MSNIPAVDFHIGAHKTATTYIQRVLSNNQDILKTSGYSIPHHRKVRKFLTVPYQTRTYRIPRFTEVELQVISENFFHSCYEPDTRRVLISDENLPGHCGQVARSGLLYPRKLVFLSLLRDFFPVEPKRIFFGVRRYGHFFSSVYGQFLLDVDPEKFVTGESTAQNVLTKFPNWVNFTKAVQKVFPNSEIVIWPFEGMRQNWDQIFGSMLNPIISQSLNTDLPPNEDTRQSMSGKSYEVFLKTLNDSGVEVALSELRKIRETHDADTTTRMSIFSREENDVLDQRYRKHMDELRDAGGKIRVLYEADF